MSGSVELARMQPLPEPTSASRSSVCLDDRRPGTLFEQGTSGGGSAFDGFPRISPSRMIPRARRHHPASEISTGDDFSLGRSARMTFSATVQSLRHRRTERGPRLSPVRVLFPDFGKAAVERSSGEVRNRPAVVPGCPNRPENSVIRSRAHALPFSPPASPDRIHPD